MNKTATGFIMNTKAVRRGGVMEVKEGSYSTKPLTKADREASKWAIEILKRIIAEREKEE